MPWKDARVTSRWHPRAWRMSWSGVVGAVIGFALSMTPSLMPRPTLFMGLLGGISAAVGYGIAVVIAWGLRRAGTPEAGEPLRRRCWQVLAVAGPIIAIAALIAGRMWQEEVRRLVGEDPAGVSIVTVPVIAVVAFTVILLIARAIRWIAHALARLLNRLIPRPAARALSILIVVLIAWWAASGLLPSAFLSAMDGIYSATNARTAPGIEQPSSALRSGSPESLVPWSTLGQEGRTFVASGPSAQQAGQFTGEPGIEPIRVYVGLDTAATPRERARIAVAELERTGAFDRAVLVVAGVTGTGWLEPQSVSSIEYVWGGNTAIVATQYSYLPSWMSFLIDRQRPAVSGQELFDAVYDAWSQRPAEARPKLIVYGLSLGSYAMQSAFATPGSIEVLTDGALFVGTPNFTEPWHYMELTRDPGTPEWKPVFENGRIIRFGPDSTSLFALDTAWESPRIAYLQHASDPVVWWSYDLIAQRPDWLAEPRGPDVSPAMQWIPIVTFLQVTVDQFFGVDVPNGHGHNYPNTIVGAWVAVTEPQNWTAQQTADLQAFIDASYPAP